MYEWVTPCGGEADGLQCSVQVKVPNATGGRQSVGCLLEVDGDQYSSRSFQYPVAWSTFDEQVLVDLALEESALYI